MGKNFTNYRKRARLVSIIVCSLISVGVGGLILGALILASKISDQAILPVFYVLGVLAIPVSAAVLCLIFVPSDKRLAKRLDEEHTLHEKVSTMVEFKDSSDPFVVLQREDADERLGRIKLKHWRKRQIISLVVVLTLSVGLFTGALLVPTAAFEEPEKPIDDFEKEWILAELSNIITTVENSLISDSLKDKSLKSLRSLYDFCSSHDYMSEMKLEATKTVIALDGFLRVENTASALGAALNASSNQTLRSIAANLVKLNGSAVQKDIAALRDVVASMDKSDASIVADEISVAITASGADPASPLTVIFANLSSGIRGYSNNSLSSLDDVFTKKVGSDASKLTATQSINALVAKTAMDDICTLFGISKDDLVGAGADQNIDTKPPEVPPTEGEGDGEVEDPDKEIGSGGIGTGDRIYGSNDTIYDPYTNTYRPFGEVLDEYTEIVLQMVIDGKIPPDFEDFTTEYFRNLSKYTPPDKEGE